MNPQCIICETNFTPTDNLYSTYCGHVFHYQCLTKWLERSPTCPQCRQQTDNQKILRIWLSDGGLNTSNKEDVSEIKKELEAKLSEVAKNRIDIKVLQDSIKWRQHTIDTLEEDLKSQKASYEKKIINLESKFDRCKYEKTKLEENLESQRISFNKKVNNLESKLDRYHSDIEDLEDELESQEEWYEEKVRNWQSKYDRCRNEKAYCKRCDWY